MHGRQYSTSKPSAAIAGNRLRLLKVEAARLGAVRPRNICTQVPNRPLAIDEHLEDAVVRRGIAPIGKARHHLAQRVGQSRLRAGVQGAGSRQRSCPIGQPASVGAGPHRVRPLGGRRNQRGALQQLSLRHLVGLEPLHEPRPPRFERVDPRFDRVLVSANLTRRELRRPAVVVDEPERSLFPRALGAVRGEPISEHAGKQAVAVGEDIRFDDDRFAGCTLHGKAARVNLGPYVVDDNAASVE
jgi:hypothetical protein